MSTSSTSVTAGEIMDRSAVLMNDPAKTDYTYDVLSPFVKMAMDELSESLIDSQSSPIPQTSEILTLPVGQNALYPIDSVSPTVVKYPSTLVEIQSIEERPAGVNTAFIPMKRTEFIVSTEPGPRLIYWTWEDQIIMFNPRGATGPIELKLRFLREFSVPSVITPDMIVGLMNVRSYLTYKVAAYAAMFIGENPQRAEVLDVKAAMALERMESINNKGRQQIMTRHRPFRSSWKKSGGY